MKRITCLALAAFFAAALPAQAVAELLPTKDNTLFESSSGSLSEGAGTGIFCGVTNMNKKRRALVRFGVASQIPAGATILSAALTLEMNQTANGPLNIDLRRVLADWGEGTSAPATGNGGSGSPATPGDATWQHRFYPSTFWATPGGDFSATASATLSVWQYGQYTWSSPQLLADVQNWLSNPSTDFGWLLKCPETTIGNAKRFASKEEPWPAARPKLTITYTAPPAASVTNLGYGCNSNLLTAVGQPVIGNAGFTLVMAGGSPGDGAYVLVGSGPVPYAIALGGGCFFDVEPVSAITNFNNGVYLGPVTIDLTGHATFSCPIPGNGALHGLGVAIQCVAVGPAITSSNVLGLLLGS
jgi:hypothetical protein